MCSSTTAYRLRLWSTITEREQKKNGAWIGGVYCCSELLLLPLWAISPPSPILSLVCSQNAFHSPSPRGTHQDGFYPRAIKAGMFLLPDLGLEEDDLDLLIFWPHCRFAEFLPGNDQDRGHARPQIQVGGGDLCLPQGWHVRYAFFPASGCHWCFLSWVNGDLLGTVWWQWHVLTSLGETLAITRRPSKISRQLSGAPKSCVQ